MHITFYGETDTQPANLLARTSLSSLRHRRSSLGRMYDKREMRVGQWEVDTLDREVNRRAVCAVKLSELCLGVEIELWCVQVDSRWVHGFWIRSGHGCRCGRLLLSVRLVVFVCWRRRGRTEVIVEEKRERDGKYDREEELAQIGQQREPSRNRSGKRHDSTVRRIINASIIIMIIIKTKYLSTTSHSRSYSTQRN